MPIAGQAACLPAAATTPIGQAQLVPQAMPQPMRMQHECKTACIGMSCKVRSMQSVHAGVQAGRHGTHIAASRPVGPFPSRMA